MVGVILVKALRGAPSHFGELDSFTYLMLNLPFQCNYHCLKCFNIEDSILGIPLDKLSSLDYPIPTPENISLDEMKRLIQEAKQLGGRAVVLAGEGEPSLDENVRELVSGIHSLDMISIVYSNGSVLTKDLIEFYRDQDASLVFSLDSLDPAVYDRLTGTKGLLPRVLNNIKSAIASYRGREETAEERRIAINTTICSPNEDEVSEIKAHFGDDIFFICNPLARSGNAERNWRKLVDSEESYQKQCQIAAELSESGGPLTLSNGICGYSRWGIAVDPSGYYMACPYTKRTSGLLGNIRNRNLRDAFDYKHDAESQHYGKYGPSRCLVRSENFGGLIGSLTK